MGLSYASELARPLPRSPKKAKPKVTAVKSKSNAGEKTPSHPSTSFMVNSVIKSMNERGGSSLQSIKKSVCGTFKVDPDRCASRIRRYLKLAVEKGDLIQTKGSGANGSFKLAAHMKAEPKKMKRASKKKLAVSYKVNSTESEPKKAEESSEKSVALKKETVKSKAINSKKTASKAESITAKTVIMKKPQLPKQKKIVSKQPAKRTKK